MEEITLENTSKLLETSYRLEGGNIDSIHLGLESDEIVINAYPEGAPVRCTFKLVNIVSFNICNRSGIEFYGLSGYPNSLEVVWSESGESVLFAIGANEKRQDFESLKACNFYVHAKKLYAQVK